MKFETSRGGDGALATHAAGSWPHTRRRQLSCQRLLGLLKAFFLCQRLEAATGPWPRTLQAVGRTSLHTRRRQLSWVTLGLFKAWWPWMSEAVHPMARLRAEILLARVLDRALLCAAANNANGSPRTFNNMQTSPQKTLCKHFCTSANHRSGAGTRKTCSQSPRGCQTVPSMCGAAIACVCGTNRRPCAT